MNQEFIRAIQENTEFQASDEISIVYQDQEPEYAILLEKYHLSEFMEEKDSQKALRMLTWINTHIHHKGDYDNSDRQDALTLLKLAFDTGYRINCLAMSIVLCECLLALRVRARVMYMMPRDAQDGDNHVVVEAFASDLNKWIMLDATYGCYCLDSDGKILNLYEMRTLVADEKPYYFSDAMNYNGMEVDDKEDVKEYYAKNLFFFRCKSIQGYGQHREYGNMLEIAPTGFDVHRRMVENLLFRIRTCGEFEIFANWKKYEESLQNRYIDIKSIY